MMLLEVEGHNPLIQTRKLRPEPKDHVRDNVRRMRQIQRASKQREVEMQSPVKALWKSSKFDGVQSRVRDHIEHAPVTPRPQTTNYLRAHSRSGFYPEPQRPSSVEPPEEKLTVPSAQISRELKLQRQNIDFIKLNGRSAAKAPIRRSPSVDALDRLKAREEDQTYSYEKGAVPKYLQDRQKQWEQDELDRKASIPDPDLPEGHRLMPDSERRVTLEKLRTTENEMLAQINSLPIRTDTPRIRARKDEMDKKLAEIDEAIRIFSRRKVFVKLDA